MWGLKMAKDKKDKHKKDHSKEKKRKRDEEEEFRHAEKARKLVNRRHDIHNVPDAISKTGVPKLQVVDTCKKLHFHCIACLTAPHRPRSLRRIFGMEMALRRIRSSCGARRLRSRYTKGET